MSAGGSREVVVPGACGMLGTEVLGACADAGIRAMGYDLPEFDITCDEHLRSALECGDIVVNCAAYTDVEKAESEKQLAYAVNAQAVGALGRRAREKNIAVIHISTDFVFDGAKDAAYTEEDAPNPVSVYGDSKLKGERLLAESGCEHCIIRVQWTYGRAGNNFIKKIIQAGRRAAAGRGEPIKVVDDQVGSPTATAEVARVIVEFLLMDKLPAGVFHFAADGCASRCDVARFVVDKLGIDVDVIACKTSDFPSAAARPLNSRFDCGKIAGLLSGPGLGPIRPWREPLGEFLIMTNE